MMRTSVLKDVKERESFASRLGTAVMQKQMGDGETGEEARPGTEVANRCS